MDREQRLDAVLCAAAGGFYLVNRLWLRETAGGWLGWFLRCYANDLFAGLALAAWLDLLLRRAARPPLRSWKGIFLYLLLCGAVWELLAPLWKSGAVFDPWDFLAYQAGGALFLLLSRKQT